MQADAQEQGQVRTQDGRFPPGVSGNPLGGLSRKRRIQAKAEELAVEFGGLHSLTAYEKGLLSVVAQIFASPYTADPPRDLRAAYQAMARLRKNVAERKAKAPTFADIMRAKHDAR